MVDTKCELLTKNRADNALSVLLFAKNEKILHLK